MGWSDADALGIGESSQGMDANPVGSGLGADEFGRIFGNRRMSRADIAYARNRALMRGLPALSGGLSVAMQEAYARGYNPWSGEPIDASAKEREALARAMAMLNMHEKARMTPTFDKMRHIENIATQKSPPNQELENFARAIGKTAQTLNTQDMQAFDKAQLQATGQSWSQKQRAFVDDKNKQVQNSRSKAYRDAISAWANKFAGQPITQANYQDYQTIDQLVGPYAYDQEAMQQMMAQRHGSDLSADTDSGWDNLAFGPDTPMGNVSFGGQMANALNTGSYDDEGMPAWGGFGYMDPTQGPGAPNNLGWDAGEFGTAPPGGYNTGVSQNSDAGLAEGGGEYIRNKPRLWDILASGGYGGFMGGTGWRPIPGQPGNVTRRFVTHANPAYTNAYDQWESDL